MNINEFESLRKSFVEGDLSSLDEVLERFGDDFNLDADFNFIDKDGYKNTGSLIFIASYFNHKDTVEKLINHFKGLYKDKEIIKEMVEKDFRGFGGHDMTAIDVAASNGNIEMFRLLSDTGASGLEPIRFAALNKRLEMLGFLLAPESTPINKEDLDEAFSSCLFGFTDFTDDKKRKKSEIHAEYNVISFLLEKGADPDHINNDQGILPLMTSLRKNDMT